VLLFQNDYYYERLKLHVARQTVAKDVRIFSGQDGSHAVIRDSKSGSDQTSHGDASCGSKPEHDWHTVNKEDVASPVF
jgi:hypothetical protein